jgi:hypothetical protein
MLIQTAVFATPASAQVGINPPPVARPGPADLVPRVTSSKSVVIGGLPLGYGVHDTVVLTVSVENRLSVYASNPKASILQGSDAQGVSLGIALGPLLRQVGNFSAGGGFQCSVAADHRSMFCWGATIPAGSSVDVTLEALAEYGPPCRAPDWAQATADPYNFIAEANELNNQAGATIVVESIC